MKCTFCLSVFLLKIVSEYDQEIPQSQTADKPGIAKDLIEADDIGRKAVADFNDSRLVKKPVLHNTIKCYNLIKFCGLRGQARRNSPIYETQTAR